MDLAILLVYSLILCFVFPPAKRKTVTKVVRVVKIEKRPYLNPEMIHDEGAFMKIANELGFS